MRFHPAVLMLLVWAGCIAAFYILPFQLEGRTMSLYGFMILALFIGAFCFGALVAARPQPQRPRPPDVTVDFRLTDRWLMAAAGVAIVAALLDVQGRNLLDLTGAYELRSDRATALMTGSASESTFWFQIAFLTYPAGYAYLVREIAFRPRPVLWRMGLFGLAPVVLASLAMGGRAPLLYALVMLVSGFMLRNQVFPRRGRVAPARSGPTGKPRRKPFKLGVPGKVAIGLFGAIAFLYFIQVFVARADVVGGVEVMFGVAQTSWGVNFNGPFSGLIFSAFGADGAYLIFIFAWYAIQGLVMSNTIFTEYDGAMLMGGYGIDLMSAAMRRLNGDFLADGYAVLLGINTYGFLPSAFGSFYVDLKFFGLVPCVLWGWLAGKVYANVKAGRDPRWLLFVPFVTFGIYFSLINSPIGFSNGLVTHIWLIWAFLLARPVRQPIAAVAPAGSQRRLAG